MDKELHEYTPSELKGMQKKALEMAGVFWGFCKEHGLTAYMCGGGLIGMLRSGGFIPWDDDIDFFMPRDDYERFTKLWGSYENGRDYALCVQSKDYVDHNIFATLRDRRTTYIKPYQKELDIVHGVQMDILPLDGYPDKDHQRICQVLWAMIYSLFCAGTPPVKHGKLLETGGKILLNFFKGKNVRYLIWQTAKKHMTKYRIDDCDALTELCSGPHYMKNRYDKRWFSGYVEVDFEGVMLPIPIGADRYLRRAFGNYMELPPVEKRVANHSCVFIDLNRPYTRYKGIYYLKEKNKRKAATG